MPKPLAQDEVNILLSAVAGGMKGKDAGEKEGCVDGIGRRLFRLEVINDRFARYAGEELPDLIQARCELNPISIDIARFGTLMRSLAVPASICIGRAAAFGGQPFLMILDSRLVFAATASCMGGSGSRIEGRDFTPIERMVAEEARKALFRCMRRAWQEAVMDFVPEHVRTESNPQFACVLGMDDPVAVLHHEAELDDALGAVTIAIPCGALKPYEGFLADPDCRFRICSCEREELIGILKADDREREMPDIAYPFPFLGGRDPGRIAQALRDDLPATAAFILSFLEPAFAAKCLLRFPAGARSDILFHMRRAKPRTGRLIPEIGKWLEKATASGEPPSRSDAAAVMERLGRLCPQARDEIIENLDEGHPGFAADILQEAAPKPDRPGQG